MFLQREELKRFINSICRVTKYFKVFLNKTKLLSIMQYVHIQYLRFSSVSTKDLHVLPC